MSFGLALAVIVEWNALYLTGPWSHNDKMVTLPLLGVGLLPILQMVVLPPATVLLLEYVWRN